MRYLIVLLAVLAGCASVEQRNRERERAEMAKKLYAALLQKKCQEYGFAPNTTAFSNCLMQLDLAVKRSAARSAEAERREPLWQYPAVRCVPSGGGVVCF